MILQPRFELGLGFHGFDRAWFVNDITSWMSVLIIELSKRLVGLVCEYNVHLIMSGHC
jgi:hypothetical protein